MFLRLRLPHQAVKPVLPASFRAIVSNGSWGYMEHDRYRPTVDIAHLLADVLSKHGNLLLDVGLKPDGNITPQEQAVLHEIGTRHDYRQALNR